MLVILGGIFDKQNIWEIFPPILRRQSPPHYTRVCLSPLGGRTRTYAYERRTCRVNTFRHSRLESHSVRLQKSRSV